MSRNVGGQRSLLPLFRSSHRVSVPSLVEMSIVWQFADNGGEGDWVGGKGYVTQRGRFWMQWVRKDRYSLSQGFARVMLRETGKRLISELGEHLISGIFEEKGEHACYFHGIKEHLTSVLSPPLPSIPLCWWYSATLLLAFSCATTQIQSKLPQVDTLGKQKKCPQLELAAYRNV